MMRTSNRGHSGKKANGSTGPRSAAGKARVSRNALQHGLSVPMIIDSELAVWVEGTAQDMAKHISARSGIDRAREVVAAVLEFGRVSSVRTALLQNEMSERHREQADAVNAIAILRRLPNLLALMRYERRALWRMRRAVEDFRICERLAANTLSSLESKR